MTEQAEFWKNRHLEHKLSYSCPNPTLFRMLSSDFTNYNDKNVLELGFGGNDGADLIEFNRRGANLCIGLDINEYYVDRLNSYARSHNLMNLQGFTCNVANIKELDSTLNSERKYDLIFSQGLLCYLDKASIKAMHMNLSKYLKESTIICHLTPEEDLILEESANQDKFMNLTSLLNSSRKESFWENNPADILETKQLIQILDECGMELFEQKISCESLDNRCERVRVYRYLKLRFK